MVRGAELVGLRVSIRWADPVKWFQGIIAEWRPYDETHLIAYDDGDQKAHNLKEEETAGQLRWITPPAPSTARGKRTAPIDKSDAAKKVKQVNKDPDEVKVKTESGGGGGIGSRKDKASANMMTKDGDGGKAKMEDLTPKPVVVEFKFTSCKSFCLDAGDWTGVLHVPMLQDPLTGFCKVPPGTTKVKGTVARADWDRAPPPANLGGKKSSVKPGKKSSAKPRHEPFEETFAANFSRTEGGPLHNFELGYDLCFEPGESGIGWQLYRAEDKHHNDDDHVGLRQSFATIPYNAEMAGWFDGQFKVKAYQGPSDPQTDDEKDEADADSTAGRHWVNGDEGKFRKHLDDWEKHAGGILQVYARTMFEPADGVDMDKMVPDADYKIKLYTVLSCHKPNMAPVKREAGAPPDWEALARLLAARFPKKPNGWAAKAVSQYQLFLELKVQHQDWDSKKFSPSAALDDVWHAHLAFVERYQRDVLALTGGARLIEHSPVLGDDARGRYAACYAAHVLKAQQPVDPEFWPEPSASGLRADEHDGDSDEHLSYGSESDQGGPSCG